tara:strand:+ start:9 stop:1925 length:1917 start_codon:yes stop_codon:yes gene_type:complete
MKIQTVNQLISVFKDISTRHYQINGFGIGDEWEIGASKAEMHPVLWINPVTATMPSTDNGYKTFEIDFEVRVFDLVSKGESNENDVLSDCIDILKDIITEFKGHPYYVNSQLNIIDDISFEAFTEEFDEEVSGWVCEISLMTPILNSFCGIPAADITGFEFPGTDCPEVNVLCPVFVEDVTGVYPIVVTTVGTTKQVSIVGGAGSDTYVISGVYDTGTLTLTRNDAVDVVVTGFASGGDNDYTTAATLAGNIITFDRTDTVGAYSVDLTSAINSAPDKFVSSGAFDDASKLLTLTLNDATDFDVDFSTLTTADKFVSTGAYDEPNNKIVLTLNDASTVDIDTSAIGGGDSIYTADDTIGAGRVATLTDTLTFKDGTVNVQGIGTAGSSALAIYDNDTTPNKLWDFLDNGNVNLGGDSTVDLGDNKLTVNFDVDTAAEVAPINFEFGGYWQGYTRWADSGAVTINVNNNDDALTIFNKVNSTNFKSKAAGGGYLGLEGSANNVWRINDGDTANSGIEFGRQLFKFYFSGAVIHRIQQGGIDGGVHFYEGGITGSLGYFIVGGNSRIGTEKICLKEPVAIKGGGTSTGSALTIYDNDTTPVKIFEVLDDSTIKTNGNAGFTGTGAYTNFTIENGIITNAT